ncbi:DUF3558 domain-containing protein [Amycolatopsis vastitatis]|uniref:DUF3558 domain-containing protein n=1 Tax=Amycolatopsis vastitatis TaxID=1905142 RepID=A0A229THA1_9PSEU|nr:DUF3558 domain-containing protein [Amycolatopsis vastitatis]OXM70626.1 hypothetical protein CF165_03920 [Amycolatopsis vastitatis]
MLATAALAGCSAGTGGTPYPVETAATAASQSAKAAQLPQRPADLPLQGVDLCEIFPQVRLDELKITSLPRSVTAATDGPTCVFDADGAEPVHSYHVRAVQADLDQWITGARKKNSMTTEPKTIGGYPALTNYRAAGEPADCETLVGVAKGQTLAVQTFAITRGKLTQPQLCDMSAHAADLALQSLKARN